MAPHSVAGRVATIVYAIVGIPIYLIILHKLGRVFLKLLHKLWNATLRIAGCLAGRSPSKYQSDEDAASGKNGKENEHNIPVSLAVGVTFVWMLTCAGVCCLFFETSWDYFTSFYFFFISLTTIGFGKRQFIFRCTVIRESLSVAGDVTPTHPEYMFTMFGLIIVGKHISGSV